MFAMGCDEVIMDEYAVLMIHGAWGEFSGNATQLSEWAGELQEASELMAIPYAEKANQIPLDVFKALVSDGQDHYFNAYDCQALGLCDSISQSTDDSISGYLQPGRYIQENELRAQKTESDSGADAEDEHMKELINRLRAALGLKL